MKALFVAVLIYENVGLEYFVFFISASNSKQRSKVSESLRSSLYLSGSWPAPHDTINTTQRRVEEAEGTPHTPALRPSSPESSSPLPSIALQSRGEVLAGGVEFSGPATSRPQPPKSRDPADELEGVMLSRSRQSSTSMHFFQSSSSRLSGPAQRPIEIGGRQGGGEEEGGGRRGGRGGRGHA